MKRRKKTLKNDVTFLLDRAKNGLVAGKKRASLITKKKKRSEVKDGDSNYHSRSISHSAFSVIKVSHYSRQRLQSWTNSFGRSAFILCLVHIFRFYFYYLLHIFILFLLLFYYYLFITIIIIYYFYIIITLLYFVFFELQVPPLPSPPNKCWA